MSAKPHGSDKDGMTAMFPDTTSSTFVGDGLGRHFRGRHCLLVLYPAPGGTLASVERPLDILGRFTGEDWERNQVPNLVRLATATVGCPTLVSTRFGGYLHTEIAAVFEYPIAFDESIRGIYVASQADNGDYLLGNHGHPLNDVGAHPAADNVALIQSTFGDYGNFELVAPVGNQLVHQWRDNNQTDPQWSAATTIVETSNGYDTVALLQDVRDNRLHVLAQAGGLLEQWTREVGPTWHWTRVQNGICGNAVGVPGLWHERRIILTTRGPTIARTDFLLGTALANGGIQLFRQPDGNAANPWITDALIAPGRTFRDVTIIQRHQPQLRSIPPPLEIFTFETGRGLQTAASASSNTPAATGTRHTSPPPSYNPRNERLRERRTRTRNSTVQ
jgi:hypothetical protein